MKILDRFINKLGYNKEIKKKEVLPWSDVPEVNAVIMGETPPQWTSKDYLKNAKGWVFSCVSVIADEIGAIDLHLYKRNKDKTEEIFEHPLLDLLYKVNNFTTKFDHWWMTQNYLEYTGEAPWLLDRDGDGLPISMFLLKPNKLEIKSSEDKIIDHYEYKPEPRRTIIFKPEDIIFIKYPSITKQFRGRGTLEAAKQTVDLDNYSEAWNVNFFYNAARPDAILTTDQKLTKEQREHLDKTWNKKFQGLNKNAKLAILESGLKYQQMQLSQKDMDFLEQQRFSRDKILAVFRVPKTAIGITEDVNRANAEATDYVFALRTIEPKMKRIVEQLNEFLVPMFGDDLFLGFTDPVPENTELKLKEYEKALKSGWMSPNEIRDKEGLPPVDGGDSIYIPMNYAPIGEPKKSKEKVINYKKINKDKNEIIKDSIKEIAKIYLKAKKKKGIENNEEEFWRKQIDIEEKYEKIFIKHLRYLFTKQEEEILRKLNKKSQDGLEKSSKELSQNLKFKKYWSEMKLSIPSVLLNIKKETKKFIITLTPIVKKVINEEGKYTLDEMDIDVVFDENEPRIDKYLDKHPIKFSKAINEKTNKDIRKTLIEGVAEGESIHKLTKRVKGIFEIATTSRAENIARTEVSRATNFSTVEAYKQSGVVKGKKWITAYDERTCERCSAMNGKIVDLDKNYFNKNDSFMGTKFDYDAVGQPPLHNRCRCTTVPVLIN